MKAGYRLTMRVARLGLALSAFGLPRQPAFAQSSRPAAVAPAKTHVATRPPARKPAVAADIGPASSNAAAVSSSAPSAPVGSIAPTGGVGGVVEAKTIDGGARVFKFSELDIEGRLKSPQLVYFLRRVRAEFAAGDLGHRSFLREMSETRGESTF